LDQAAAAFARLATLQDRHNRLQKLAITDQLTGIYNRRYFEHFLSTILERAKSMRFQVTLLMFDIDDFKRYNDECGHGLGDEILKETAALMRICCREHDLVARVGGDEFAVVFWEKEPPRQPKDPAKPITPGRVPQEPLQILRRFRRTISKRQFTGLGSAGRGTLTISGGLATFPWDGFTAQELIQAADRALTFGAKKSGKNSIYLVGGDEQKWADDLPATTPDSTPGDARP
jgi:GGDEF domain-containing protein